MFFISFLSSTFQEITNLNFCFLFKETKLRLFCKAKQTSKDVRGGQQNLCLCHQLNCVHLAAAVRLRATQRLLRSQANEERDGDDFRGAQETQKRLKYYIAFQYTIYDFLLAAIREELRRCYTATTTFQSLLEIRRSDNNSYFFSLSFYKSFWCYNE